MNLADFHFIRPYWLLAILPMIAIAFLLLRKKLNQGNWINYCDAELLPFLLQETNTKQSRLSLFIGITASLLMMIALAGPTWQRLPAPAFRNDAALVIVLNLSRTMDASDIKPSRLTIARYKIADILKQRKDGQTALLVYSGDAFTVTPLTNDTNTIDSQLTALTTDIMPSQGNNTAKALEKAMDLFKQAGLQAGQILLVTDSVNLDDTLPMVKKLDNFQLSVLGIGTEGGAPIALPEGGFLKDEQGSIVVTKLDIEQLSTLTREGRGSYQTLTPDDSDIQFLLRTFDKPVQQQSKKRDDITLEQWEEQGVWLLLAVLPLGALFFRKGLLCIALFLLLPIPKNSYAFSWQDLWQRKDQQAYQAYQQKEYAKAAEKFQNPDWKAAAQYQAGDYDKALKNYQSQSKQTADHWYNQANALAQAGQLKEALAAYEKALELNPNDSDAQYNADIVKKALEKQQQPPSSEKQQKEEQSQKQDQKKQSQDKQQDNKSSQTEQKQSEKTEEQQAEQQNSEKPEQKPEKRQQQIEQQEEEKKQQNQEQQAKAKADDKKSSAQQTPVKAKPAAKNDEKQQANEQWLNRIPDDPAGLLKRKFKYQYGRQQE